LRSTRSLKAENLFLRRQFALYVERSAKRLAPSRMEIVLAAQIPTWPAADSRRMANENPSWGEERIANELLLKLGIRVSPRTVRK
jgi:hypothetical protein